MSPRDFSGRARSRPSVPAWVMLSLPAAALVSVLVAAQSARTATASTSAHLQRVQQEVEDTRARSAVLRRDPRFAARGGGTAREAAPGVVLAALETAMPKDVRLVGLTLTYESDLNLLIELEAGSPAAWDQFVQQLATHPRFSGVLPGDELRVGAMRATVTAAWRP